MNDRRVFLIGPMGAGKTTLAKYLSEDFQIQFYDSDHEIVNRTGADIPWIFDVEGEEGFRNRETMILNELTLESPVIIATGGGAILREENRKMLADRGLVVFLDVSLTEQFKRISHDKNRPLIQTANPRERLAKMREQRLPLYQSIADLTIHTDDENVDSAIKKIKLAINQK